MKKTIFLLIFAVFLALNISAQEPHKNAINFGTTGLLGIAVGYERMLLSNFSMTVDIGYGLYLSPSFYTSIGARWYPVSDSNGKTAGFFLSVSAGYGEISERESLFAWEKDSNPYDIWGFMISPSLGFKIGSGKPRGFMVTPMIGADIFLGEKTIYDKVYEDKYKKESEFGLGFNPSFKLLFGYAF